MRMPINLIPEEFATLYNLHEKVKNGFVYMQIEKGMYGLPQAGILANKLLRKRLAPHGYYEMPHTPGLWRHIHRPIQFTLVVDDFGVKYTGKEHADHLLHALKTKYEVSEDWDGQLYCGIKLQWNYNEKYVDTSMRTYVEKQRLKYKHVRPKKLQDTPLQPLQRTYGKESQNPNPPDDSPLLNNKKQKLVQQVIGGFLYYGRAVDPLILHALSVLASQQSAPTENTMIKVNTFLDYMSWHPDAVIRFYASDMVLNVHSDASYLTAAKARSRAGGHYFLGSIPIDGHPIKLNAAIHSLCTILKMVVSSAAEAELGALFLNAKEARIIRLTLKELGHPQPPTPIHIDNTTVIGIVNNTIKRQRSRAMEMKFFWLLDKQAQSEFKFYYHPGQENLGDYHTKAFTAKDTNRARPFYVHDKHSPRILVRAFMPSLRRWRVGNIPSPYVCRKPLPVLPRIQSRMTTSPAA